MDNNTEYNGPIHGKVKLKPSAFEASSDGGDLVPAQGYSTASINYADYGNGGLLDLAGVGAKLTSDYPSINSNESPHNGRNPYEPLRIPFIHKMGGPHVDSNDHLTFIQGDYRTEEFARVKLQPDKTDNVFSPYTCATVTGVAFPYGQTNKGIIHPDINKIKTVLFRNKFTFDLVHPNVNEGPDLYNYDPTNPGTSTPGAAYYSPLYSSSIVNTYNGYTREFELKTNGYDLIQTYGLYGDALGPKNLLALSIHPELSRGETSSFFGPNSYTVNASPELAGAYSIGYPYDNIQYVVQGETDGTTVSFLVQSQPGCIIKGLIELF